MASADPAPRAEEPSSSRQRAGDGVWPEPFVEAVAVQVAVDAAESAGRLAAAPAVATVFQVCSSWHVVSHSELLWQNLTRRIWSRDRRRLPTWRAEYARCHRTGRNFRLRNCVHSTLFLAPTLSCRRLALSGRHLAAGFLDGTVRLFDLSTAALVATLLPHPGRDILGAFSQAISGVLLLDRSSRLVYASQDGDIHVAPTRGDAMHAARRVRVGNAMEDGALVDFVGRDRWWVGLFAGVPGRSLRVWDGDTEQLVHVGGSLTDPDAVVGWHMLAELAGPAGRVKFSDSGTVVGCTGSRMQVVGLDDPEAVLAEHEFRRGAAVDTVDASDGRVMVVDGHGVAKVRVARTLDVVCRFNTVRRRAAQQQQPQAGGRLVGCMNWGYAVVCCADGTVRVWDVLTGEYLYSFRLRVPGPPGAAAADDRRVAVWCGETGLHLWDFDQL